jgi:integrase
MDHSQPLRRFFQQIRLNKITVPMVYAYIAERRAAGRANAKINKEVGILAGMLRRARRWHLLAEDIKRLPERSSVGRAMSYDEKVKLLRAGVGKPRWERAQQAMTLALNTTMRAGELKGLLWRDIDWMERTLTVNRSKTRAGERVIPLNREAFRVLLEIRKQSMLLFGEEISPDWYVFYWEPGSGQPDPTRPAKGWRSAWRAMVKAAGLEGLRFHDLRHHAITELSESLSSDETIMSIAGHIDRRMMSHYSHIRMAAKRTALDNICGPCPSRTEGREDSGNQVWDSEANITATSQSTAQSTEVVPGPSFQVIGKYGGDDETRTRDLCRDSTAF